MRKLNKNEIPAELSDMDMDAATGGDIGEEVLVSSIKSPRDPASGQATGKTRGFVADSFSFGVERE